MIPSTDYRKVHIYITTLNHKRLEIKELRAMNDTRSRHCKQVPNKFICSICLNTKPGDEKIVNDGEKRKTKSCPICQKSDDTKTVFNNNVSKIDGPTNKVVQTSQTDVTQGLNLLNEVLTVFQSKKQLEQKTVKTLIFKDASVSTDYCAADLRPKLSVSKIFQFSIEENKNKDNNTFLIVNCCQPDVVTKSLYSINLRKHKSSSIPQMKMEELKNSLKEKTKSKDAIEEVNRMFATVRRNDKESVDDTNRPMIRHGPRVLPVVKTENVNRREPSDESEEIIRRRSCKCCQTNNYLMSGGDSSREIKCCYTRNEREKEKCDKGIYMLCCHYDDHRNKLQTGVMFCECCGKKSKEFYKKDRDHDFIDSATSF